MRHPTRSSCLVLALCALSCGDKTPPGRGGRQAPAIGSIAPTRGPKEGGTVAVVRGLNFRDGALVFFGEKEATFVKVVDARTLTAVTPASDGPVDVVVTSADGLTARLADGFTYYARDAATLPPPEVTSIAPNTGPAAGGTYALVTGDKIQDGALLFVGRAPASEVVATAPSLISGRLGPGDVGSADVEVTNPDGQSGRLSNAFAYYAEEGPGPTIAGLSPMSGPTVGGTPVDVVGKGFRAGALVLFGGRPASGVVATGEAALSSRTPNGNPGVVDVAVTNPDGRSDVLRGAFNFYDSGPVISSVEPNFGPVGGGTAVAIHGRHFDKKAVATLGGQTVGSLAWVDDRMLTGVTGPGRTGAADAYLRNPDGQSDTLVAAFNYGGTGGTTGFAVTRAIPEAGPTTGGTRVTLLGAGFDGTAKVTVGAAAATSVRFLSAGSLVIVIPAGNIGPAEIEVTVGTKTAKLANGFWYFDGASRKSAPTVARVTPGSGPMPGGTMTLVAGTHFVQGARVFFGAVEARSVRFVQAITLTAVTNTSTVAGAVDVRVQNPDGQVAILASGFAYLDPSTLGPGPVVASVTPSSGPTIDPTDVNLTTQNADVGALVFVDGVPASGVVVNSPSSVNATVPPGNAGAVDVTLTNPDGQSGTLVKGFTYTVPPPSIASVSPTTVPLAGNVTVIVTGKGFQIGAQVAVDGTAAAATVIDSTLLSFIAPAHAVGAATVAVTNPDNQMATAAGALSYADIILGPPPTVDSIVPASGPSTGGTLALLRGTNFAAGARVLFGKGASSKVTVMDDKRLSAIAPAGAIGGVDVTVINVDGQAGQLVRGFTYVDPASLGTPPNLASVTPAQGPSTGGTTTILTGGAFQTGMLVFFGGFIANASAVQNAGIATAVTPAGPTGTVDVAVTNPDGQTSTLTASFKFIPRPAPQNIAPTNGPTAGATSFTLAGAAFVTGAKVYFGGVQSADAAVQSATVITGTTPAHGPGPVDVKVVNPDGQSGTMVAGFTYVAPPAAQQVRPGAGTVAGGTAVLVSGTAFVSGAKVSFGTAAASAAQFLDATRLLATTPAASPGRLDVKVENPDGQSSTIAGGFVYETPDFEAGRKTAYPDHYVPGARDDAAYRTDLGVVNLSAKPVAVTLTSVDGSGATIATRAAPANVPPFGRAIVADALQYIASATVPTDKTASIVVQADGPVVPFTVVIDRASNDASVLFGTTAARGAARAIVPYAASVGAFKTALYVLNVGSAAATVDITARNGLGTPAGKLSAVAIPAGGQYTSDDVLGAMSVSNTVATLEIAGTGAQVVAAARVYSNTRLGAVVVGRAAGDASPTLSLPYVPDTSQETSTIYVANSDNANAAAATLTLRASNGQSLGTKLVTIPGAGFAQVADLARTVLGKSVATETVSTVEITGDRALFAVAQVLNIGSSDVRLAAARPGGATRLVSPFADGRTSLTVMNNGIAAATLEIVLRLDSGDARGTPVKVTVAPLGQYHASLVLASLGSPNAAGWVEVRSTNGQPLAAISKVGTDANGARGDALDLGSVLTVPALDSIRPSTGPATGGTMALLSGAYFLPSATVIFGSVPSARAFVAADDAAVAVTPPGTIGSTVDVALVNFDGSRATLAKGFGYVDPSTLGSAPAVAAVTPSQISTLGKTAIQASGSNFLANPLVFVGLSPATGVNLVNPNRIDAAAPPGPVGPADVTVTNTDGQSATLANAVTYVVPPPSVITVSPSSGPGKGGTSVRLTGDAFQVGATVAFGSNLATGVNVVSTTQIDVTTPAGTDGPVAVTVTNPDGQTVTVNNGFSYVAGPEVLSVAPTSGPTVGGTNIQITGKYFRTGAAVTIGTTAVSGCTVQTGGTVIACTTPAGSAGPAAVTVTNTDLQSGVLNNAFTYLAPIPPPTVTAVSPNYGPTTGGTQVTIQGKDFQAGAVVKFGTTNAVGVTVLSPSAITATAPGVAAQGAVDVEVVNPDGQSGKLATGFNYFQQGNLPAIAVVQVVPNEGPPAGGNNVFISGAGFKVGVTVRFGTALSPTVNYLGPSALYVVAPANPAGLVSVTATNPDGTNATLTSAYNYTVGVTFLQPPMRLPMLVERGNGILALFDADLDGDLDAFLGRRQVNCENTGDDELFLNDGTGTFTNLPSFPGDLRRETVSAVVADFDANGFKDVFAISNYLGTPGSFWRNAGGSFTRVDLPVLGCCPPTPRSIAIGDLNTDGRPDVYVATAGQEVWYRNNGGTPVTFTLATTGLPAVVDDSVAPCIADYDKDGDDDLFVVNASNQQANYYLQGPAGTFTNATASGKILPVVGGNGTGCVTAELRPGSGTKDIVVGKNGQIYQYLRNDGFGSFTDEAATFNIRRLPNPPPDLVIGFPSPTTAFGNLVGGVVAVDIDLDGDLDLLMNHPNLNPRIQVYLNDGAGFFAVGTATRVPATLLADAWFAVGDVNSDTLPDVLQSGNDVQHRLLLGQTGGALKYATMKSMPDQHYCAMDAVAADIDKDGDQDLVLGTGGFSACGSAFCEPSWQRASGVRIWLNDGAGGFSDLTSTRFPAVFTNIRTLAVRDFDGDGDLDVLIGTGGLDGIAGTGWYGLRLFFNDGTGVFKEVTYPRIPFEQYAAKSITVLDFNLDGSPDIYVGVDTLYYCGHSQRLYQNTGNGFFFDVTGQLPYRNSGICLPLRSSTTSDFNGDGYPDLYIGLNGVNRMFLNAGAVNPGFYADVTNSNVPNVPDDTWAVVSGSLNPSTDTIPDLFICNQASDRINLNSATGVLSDVSATNWPAETEPYPYQAICAGSYTPIHAFSADLGDVDQDGDLDIAIGAEWQGSIRGRKKLYLNVGNATFQDKSTKLPFDTDYTPRVLFFKANADAYPDLFVGNCGQPRVYLNQP